MTAGAWPIPGGDGMRGTALFSPCGEHRMRLDRWWAPGPRALVCMANPSMAGVLTNDPTVLSLIRLLRPLYPGFTVVNFEDRVATDPMDLSRWLLDMYSRESSRLVNLRTANVRLIRKLSSRAAARIVACGNLVDLEGRHSREVLLALSCGGTRELLCLGTTASGAPKHPMARGRSRIPIGTVPTAWRWS